MTPWLRFTVIALVVAGMGGCGKNSKTPELSPDAIVTVRGQFLAPDGTGLGDIPVDLKNLRVFAFIDYTNVALDTIIFYPMRFFLGNAFPFFPNLWPDQAFIEREKRPNYYFEHARTNHDGTFKFGVRAGNLLRDSVREINLELVNGRREGLSSARYAFVLTKQEMILDPLRLCTLGPPTTDVVSDPDNVLITWPVPPDAVQRYLVNFGVKSDHSLIWASEVTPVEGATTVSLSLPKTIFSDLTAEFAIEAYTVFKTEMKHSCVSVPVALTLPKPVASLAKGTAAIADGVQFKISSLTNGKFHDPVYFAAFDVRTITLDLGAVKSVTAVVLHNLSLAAGGGELTLDSSPDGQTWSTPTRQAEQRFIVIRPAGALTARYLRLTFSSKLQDLKEVTVL